MHSLPAAVARAPRRARSGPAAWLAAFALGAGLLGAGAAQVVSRGGEPSNASRALPALIGGVPLQQARCEQWLAGSDAERKAVVRALAGVVGGPTPGGRGTTLASGEAQRLFDHACASPVARGFLLYELYIRAAGFRSFMKPSGQE
jgi:hypothetical protein